MSNFFFDNSYSVKDLERISEEIRLDILDMLFKAQSGHPASSFDIVEILVTLYFKVMRINPKRPQWRERDFFILSNGHAVPALYAVLSRRGFFNKKLLFSLRELGSPLQGHPHRNLSLGIEASTGSLGQGISQAVGLAASLKRDGKSNRVFVTVGDGELEEGSFWESLLFASKENLGNLYIIIDRNFIQIDGDTEFVSSLEPLNKKLVSFNCRSIEINGNSIIQLLKAFEHLENLSNVKDSDSSKINVIIAKTVSGKGISFIEGKSEWHGKVFSEKDFLLAKREISERLIKFYESVEGNKK